MMDMFDLYKDGKKVEKPYPSLKWTKTGDLDPRATVQNAGYELRPTPIKTFYDRAFFSRMTQENPLIQRFLKRRRT